MDNQVISTTIVKNGKTLNLFVANLHSERISKHVELVVTRAFSKISMCLKEDIQVLYIRDDFGLCIADRGDWSARCNSPNEATIAIPAWAEDCVTMDHFLFAVHQTLYKLARLQNFGPSRIFGDEILNRGLAANYAYTMTGWIPPSVESVKITKKMRKKAVKRWFNNYDESKSNKGWFNEYWRRGNATALGCEFSDLMRHREPIESFSTRQGMKLGGLRFAVEIRY